MQVLILVLIDWHGFLPSLSHEKPGQARPSHDEMVRSLRWNAESRQVVRSVLQGTELDTEDLAFKNHDPTALLGWTDELGAWYGGKVSFAVRLLFGCRQIRGASISLWNARSYIA